jgi:hypothetical protein
MTAPALCGSALRQRSALNLIINSPHGGEWWKRALSATALGQQLLRRHTSTLSDINTLVRSMNGCDCRHVPKGRLLQIAGMQIVFKKHVTTCR